MQLMSRRAKAFDMSGGTLNQFPWLRFFAPEWSGYNIIMRINAELKEMIMVRRRPKGTPSYCSWSLFLRCKQTINLTR
jgi:hypothetical protein